MEKSHIKKEIRYRYLLCITALAVYLGLFFFVESLNLNYRVIYHPVDDLIPFNQYFIVPYMSWFFYASGFTIYFIHTSKGPEFKNYVGMVFGGMLLCLAIYIIFPNMVELRPIDAGEDGVFMRLVEIIHRVDTSANVCPSIHVYVTMIVHLTLIRVAGTSKNTMLKMLSKVVAVSIILSTMFIKQHSVIDVFWGMVMALTIFKLVESRSSKNWRAREIHG